MSITKKKKQRNKTVSLTSIYFNRYASTTVKLKKKVLNTKMKKE